MDQAQHLNKQIWVFDDASISANGFIANISATDLTLVLDLDELDVGDEAEHFDDMANDLVSWDGLD